jgi:hypothetical protein
VFKRLCGALCLLVLTAGTSSQAADFVWRKPGLWEVAIWKEGETSERAVKVQQCTDGKSEPDVLLSIVPGQEHCAPMKTVLSSKRREIKTQCLVHSLTVKAQLTMNGDFSAAYSGKVRVQYVPQSAAAPANTVFEAKWIGPCRSGMVSGDMVLSNGITVNVLKDKLARESEPESH